MKIYNQTTKIYYQALKIYNQTMKIVSPGVLQCFVPRNRMFPFLIFQVFLLYMHQNKSPGP